MKQIFHLINVMLVVVMMGCTKAGQEKSAVSSRVSAPKDTIHTREAAMDIYGYQPVKALGIIDEAVAIGNFSEWQADMCRAKIYGGTVMRAQLDSLLGLPAGACLDTAQAIAERLLSHDSVKNHLKRRMEVLENLVYIERMQNDTMGWLQRSREYIGVCRKIGAEAETDALRTEAEVGAAYHAIGRHEEGMAKLDSVIARLEVSLLREGKHGTFDKLDALIIALKRKIVMLGSHNQYAETLPLARRILELLTDYEITPDASLHLRPGRTPGVPSKLLLSIHDEGNKAKRSGRTFQITTYSSLELSYLYLLCVNGHYPRQTEHRYLLQNV